MIDGLLEAWGLKALSRAGWERRGLLDVESVAAHSWGIATLVLCLLPDELDRERALSYALLHDLPEVRIGDITPHDGVSKADKAAMESDAMASLCAALPNGDRLLALWHNYEAQQDPEARFVRQLDRLDMAIQAAHYHQTTGIDTTEFIDSAAQVIKDPTLVALLDAIRERLR